MNELCFFFAFRLNAHNKFARVITAIWAGKMGELIRPASLTAPNLRHLERVIECVHPS